MAELGTDKVKVTGEIPAARFGHSFTLMSKTKAVLFGGAIGDSGKFIITNETYLFDFSLKKWKKLDCQGQVPTQRAAHAAAQIEQMQMVVYGGAASGGGGLSSDDLYLLDLRNNEVNPSWIIIPVQGATPGKRYGHTLVFFKPFLIVFGGNTGTVPVNDVWVLNVEKAPYVWNKFVCEGDNPSVRVYHSSSLCQTGSANGMMVTFGGRTADQSALNDCWGLRRHRDGRWDWVQAPYKQNGDLPICRYQHWITFLGPLMIVIGGRTNSNEEQSQMLEVYDTESSDWYKINSVNRYRHTILMLDTTMYIHGGFEPDFPNKPLDSLITLDIQKISQLFPKLAKTLGSKDQQLNILQESFNKNVNLSNIPQTQNQTLMMKPQSNIQQSQQQQQILQQTVQKTGQKPMLGNQERSITPIKNAHQKNSSKNIRLSNQAVVATTYGPEEETNGLIRLVPLQKLQEEGKKLNVGVQYPSLITGLNNCESMCEIFLQGLLRPDEWKPNEGRLPFKRELVCRLCDEMLKSMEQYPSLLRLRVPIKIFGSIHGRFNELLRFFENFGLPCEDQGFGGDIEKFDYLFLGNYVDRGSNSLEIICLLFALKLKFPEQVHMLRGSHEDRRVNRLFGFAEECTLRLGEDTSDPQSVYQKINRVFDLLPLAALVEEKILCIHGGIGKNITSLQDIEDIQRPVNMWDSGAANVGGLIAQELLWSDFINQDINYVENRAKDIFGTGTITKFGEVKLQTFLEYNNLSMVIRSHECIQDGFEKNDNGTLITIFSCPDYGGKYGNSGAMIKIKKNFELTPHILSATQSKVGIWLNGDINTKSNLLFDEEEVKMKKRPYTPPRSMRK